MQAEFSCQREHEQIHLFIAEKLSKREHEQTHLFIAEKLSKRELEQTHLFIAEKLSKREHEQTHLFIAEKLSKRELEQTHLFIAEKLSKRELEQTHLFIAECSQLWMKSVQPALDKISAAENGKCFNAIANLFDIAEAQPLMDKVKTSFAASSRSSLMKNQYI